MTLVTSASGPHPTAAVAVVRLAGAALLVLVAVAGRPADALAQAPVDRSCEFAPGTSDLNMVTLAGGAQIVNVRTPRIRCNDGVRIAADSAITFTAQSLTQLFGNVRYSDASRTLTSDEASYFSNTARLQASGNMVLTDTERGTTVRNGDLVYLRETEYRPREEITVTTTVDNIRPVADLLLGGDGAGEAPDGAPVDPAAAPADSATAVADSAAATPGAAPDTPVPTRVEANQLYLVGDGYFQARGRVEIRRDSLDAFADSATYDDVAERMHLGGSARIVQTTWDLEGRVIDVTMPGGEISDVVARRDAVLTGEDLVLRAPAIRIFMDDGALNRLVATRLTAPAPGEAADSAMLLQPVARSETFVLRADSLDVLAPAQNLERIWAVGRARGDSSARDSLNVDALPPEARTDWMQGDTVIATFARADRTPDPFPGVAVDPSETAPAAAPPAADTTDAEYVLEELVAAGDARSLYRLEPSDSTARPGQDPPALHYVRGSRITITMRDGEVQAMNVDGPTRGYHLEPLAARPRGDTLVVDSLAVPVDTLALDTLAVPPVDTWPPGTSPSLSHSSLAPAATRPGSRAPLPGPPPRASTPAPAPDPTPPLRPDRPTPARSHPRRRP